MWCAAVRSPAAVILAAAPADAPAATQAATQAPTDDERRAARRAEVAKGLFFVGVSGIELVTFTALAWHDRDESRGRRLAVLGAAGGGTSLGLALGRWLAPRIAPEHPRMVAFTSAALGLAAGGVIGWYATREPGWSRPVTTAAGMTPVFVMMTNSYWPW